MNKRKLKKALRRIKYLPRNKDLFFYMSNKIRHFHLKLIKSTKVAYPSTIMLELTNYCNLACTICPRESTYGNEMDKGMMDTEKAKNIIDEVSPYLDSIGLTGMGETFMYKKIEEVVDYIKEKNKGIIISVSTNAVLPNFIDKVKNLVDKIDTIQISIDGLDEVYDSIRINSDFNLLENNIKTLTKLCQNSSTDLMLNMVITKENYKYMPRLVKFADSVNINYVDFTLFNLAAVTDYSIDYYKFYESKEFLDVVAELRKEIVNAKNVYVTERDFKTDNSFQKCPFPWSHFYISQDGYIPPCCAKPFPKEKNFGNVFDNNLIAILNSDNFKKWREMWYKNITPDFCKRCYFVNVKPVKVHNR